jgi:hypothetical protein
MTSLDLSATDLALIEDALIAKAAHLTGLSDNDGPHVSQPTRREWRRRASDFRQLAYRIQQTKDGR